MRAIALSVFAVVLMGCASGAADEYDAAFDNFKLTYARTYVSKEEEAKRRDYFVANMKKAAQLQGANPLAKFGVNEYADLSAGEFKAMHSAAAYYERAAAQHKPTPVAADVAAGAGSSIDWRAKGAVTYVKNQGLHCGSCWSFSTTGNIEGQWKLAGNPLVALSEQELVSCDPTNGGCHGGLMDLAFEWLVSARGGGITSEQDYPYVSGDGVVPACAMSGKPNVAYITGHHDIAHSESEMAAYLFANGPISIGVDATSWQTYQGGVLTNCISTKVDHGVLAVGYDDTASPPYWIIKNSWGPSWGEQGYIRVEKGTNQCLITTAPSSSIAGSGPVPPPPGPNPPGPNPPAPPATGTFTQYQCPGSMCFSGCTQHTFATGQCLPMANGGSAKASCGSEYLTMQVFASSSDCTGPSQQEQTPLEQCLQDQSGTYIYDKCNAAAVAAVLPKLTANVSVPLRK